MSPIEAPGDGAIEPIASLGEGSIDAIALGDGSITTVSWSWALPYAGELTPVRLSAVDDWLVIVRYPAAVAAGSVIRTQASLTESEPPPLLQALTAATRTAAVATASAARVDLAKSVISDSCRSAAGGPVSR
jgi:hypothetical protein